MANRRVLKRIIVLPKTPSGSVSCQATLHFIVYYTIIKYLCSSDTNFLRISEDHAVTA